MAFPDIVIGSKLDAKGFKQAETASQKLEKRVKNLAKSFAVAFSATAVLNFAKASAKAFIEDDNAARSLGMTIKNLGLDYAGTEANVATFINNLEKQTGVLDDELRPAMDRLLRATGSVSKSQELLNLSLDVAAGTGKTVTQVSQSLQKAYLGQTQAIGRLGVGISKAELATGNFEDIQQKLATLFAGQASSAAESYAGQIARLEVASNNAKETIGGGLVEAFRILSGDTGIGGATKAIDKFATEISDTVIGLALLIDKLKNIPIAGKGFTVLLENYTKILQGLSPLLKVFIDAQEYLSKLGANQTKPFTIGMSVTGASDYYTGQATALAKAEAKAAADRLKAIKAAAATKIKTDKAAATKDLSLKKAAAVFDLNKIQIAAALKATYDKDERLRLLAMQAIENDNGEAALEYIKMMGLLTKEQQTNKLAGITTISETELNYINQLLLDELQRIKTTKMSEEEAALARQAAYAKYNAAIAASGGLATANFYTEKTQVELISIAKLASLDTVAAAQATMDLLNYTTQKTIIERIAAAQKIADDAKYKALQDYLALLATPINPPVLVPPSGPQGPKFGIGGQPIYPEGGGFADYMGTATTSSSGGSVDNSVTIVVEGSVLDGDDFSDIINRAMLDNIRRGFSQSPAGALP